MDRIDIGNVRGIQGEKGERGEKGSSPSYEDLKYVKRNGEFVVLTTDCNITQSQYYLDKNRNLCNSEGYLYDDNNQITNVIGEPFDVNEYGYYYEQLYLDCNDKFTNSKGELLDDEYKVQYIQSNFIRDISNYIYKDEEGCNLLVETLTPYLASILVNADPNSEEYRAFFDEIEGDIKYYLCEDNPKTTIYLDDNDELVNTCKYRDEDGVVVSSNGSYDYVPLEKNALYLYNANGFEDNDIMHYDIYVCLKHNTVPKKLVSANDFIVNYNVIDDVIIEAEENNVIHENDVYINFLTRGTSGQFYNIHDVDTLFENNVINKLGANNGIAQLNNSGKVPASQLPAYIDDVVEGTMNSAITNFTPSDETYIDSVRQKGKIYVDTSTRKTYRWTGSAYVLISNPIVVSDGSTEAYSSASGIILENTIGNTTLSTTNQTLTGAINELNTNKVDKVSGKGLSTNDFTNGYKNQISALVLQTESTKTNINNLSNNKVDKVSGKGLSTNDFTDAYKTILDNLSQGSGTGGSSNVVVDSSLSSSSTNPLQNKAIYSELQNKANTNHSHYSLEKYDSISENDDLNDFTTMGWYTTNKGSTLSNRPLGISTHFILEVKEFTSNSSKIQIIYNINQNNATNKIFYRIGYIDSGTLIWYDWKQIITNDNITQLVDNNAGNYTNISPTSSPLTSSSSQQQINSAINSKIGSLSNTISSGLDNISEVIVGTHDSLNDTSSYYYIQGTASKLTSVSRGTVIYLRFPEIPDTDKPIKLNLTLASGTTLNDQTIYGTTGIGIRGNYVTNSIVMLVYDEGWKVVNYNADRNTYPNLGITTQNNSQQTINSAINTLFGNLDTSLDDTITNLETFIKLYDGRNLISNSQHFQNTNTGTLTGDYYNNCAVRYVDNTNGNDYIEYKYSNTPPVGTFEGGDRYKVTFWAKGDRISVMFSGELPSTYSPETVQIQSKVIEYTSNCVPTQTTEYDDYGNVECILTNDWQKYSITYELDPNNNNTNIPKFLALRTREGHYNYVCGLIFEKIGGAPLKTPFAPTTTIPVTITYTDNSTETINLYYESRGQ